MNVQPPGLSRRLVVRPGSRLCAVQERVGQRHKAEVWGDPKTLHSLAGACQ